MANKLHFMLVGPAGVDKQIFEVDATDETLAQLRTKLADSDIQGPIDIQSVYKELADATTTNLTASSTYTGSSIDSQPTSGNHCTRIVGSYSASHSGTLTIQFSDDGTNWYDQLILPSDTKGTFELPFYRRYARLKYVNGGTTQTSFSLSAYKSAMGGIDRPAQIRGSWVQRASVAANTAMTITKSAGGAGVRHYLTGFEVAIAGAAAASDIVVTLKDGSTTIYATVIGSGAPRGERVGVIFNPPIECTANQALELSTLAGGAGVTQYGNLMGITV